MNPKPIKSYNQDYQIAYNEDYYSIFIPSYLKNLKIDLILSELAQDKVETSIDRKGAATWINDGTALNLKDENEQYIENSYGHLPYKDCSEADLVTLNNGIKVHKDTYAAFKKMQEAAKKDGCNLYILSGFRSKEYQYNLFTKYKRDGYTSIYALFEKMSIEEKQARAKWSAIPGYSEHHTGYAIDIVTIDTSFENSKEYKWLEEHAAEYGFEISFQKDNKQGVRFEPWHWRYIGNEEAQKIFKAAKMIAQ